MASTKSKRSQLKSPVEAGPGPAGALVPGPELAIVAPTFNEQPNVTLLYERIARALPGIDWELIFVDDDSPDGTASAARELAVRDRRVRCIRRVGRRGLASASIEGMLAASAPYVAVIDADLQHDETRLGVMLERARAGAELVIGTRFADGGDVGRFSPARQRISGFSAWLSRLTFRAEVSDPMSGFFLLRRDTLENLAPRLTGTGFKILVDILASTSRPLVIEEVPFVFGERRHGQSKLDTLVAFEFAELLLDKLLGRYLPVRFLKFALVGGSGLIVHLAVLWAALDYTGDRFALSQAIATAAAITSNFFINNWFTYRDRRLRGWRMLAGLASFYGICGLGAVASVGVGSLIYVREPIWWLAGAAGALIGAVWNFAVSSVYTWRKH